MLDNAGPALGPIVAVGASAGGLESISRLFEHLPASGGMTFIVVQHLEPTHKSLMVDLLAEHTAMPVSEAFEGCALRPNHVYVIPPGRYLSVRTGHLHLSAPDTPHGVRLPFDHLLLPPARPILPKSATRRCSPAMHRRQCSSTGATSVSIRRV